jgi:DNA-binding response OmpR family regulator
MQMGKKIGHILVATSNEKESLNISSRLRTQGFRVRQSSGGFQTLSLLEDDKAATDCVLFVGQSLDEMSVHETIAHIRTQWDAEHLCIIHLSDDQAVLFTSISQGANHALSGRNFNDVLGRIKSVRLK